MISGGIKINQFVQIGSVIKAYFGDSLLQVLLLTLFVLYFSNDFGITGSFAIKLGDFKQIFYLNQFQNGFINFYGHLFPWQLPKLYSTNLFKNLS